MPDEPPLTCQPVARTACPIAENVFGEVAEHLEAGKACDGHRHAQARNRNVVDVAGGSQLEHVALVFEELIAALFGEQLHAAPVAHRPDDRRLLAGLTDAALLQKGIALMVEGPAESNRILGKVGHRKAHGLGLRHRHLTQPRLDFRLVVNLTRTEDLHLVQTVHGSLLPIQISHPQTVKTFHELRCIRSVEIKVELEQDNQQLGEVVVVADAKKNTENAIITQQRTSLVMQTGVSAQQITKTQDKDASEVIRRVSGISIIEEKFVMVRGLSQRYNNVWINNSAVPSSEADARAFSFDIIPSSQLDNMLVVKSPAPEYPADFSGGFILVNTKDVPSSNLFTISVGTSLNDQTHFKKFLYNKGSGTDFLGFDNGFRSLKGGINAVLNPINNGYDLLNNGLNNDWTVKDRRPLADLSMNMNFSRRWVDSSGRTLAMLGTVNYSNSYKTYLDMDNNLFGAYDTTHDCSNYLRKSIDDQYNHNVRC